MAIVHRLLRTIAPTQLRCLTTSRFFSSKPPESTPTNLIKLEMDNSSGVAVVKLCNPPANVLNTPLLDELRGTIEELERDKVRGMILTSDSETIFSAGLDINEMFTIRKDKLVNFWSALQSAWLALYRTSIPTAAAITGHAPAGGCLLALSCEYRVMVGPKFTIGLNETQLGIVAPPWFVICMQDAVGKRHTEMSLTTGKMYTAPEALEIGLIDKMVGTRQEAMTEAVNFIAKFKNIPPSARKLTKEAIRKEGIEFMQKHVVDDLENFVNFTMQPEIQKGLGRYLYTLKNKEMKK